LGSVLLTYLAERASLDGRHRNALLLYAVYGAGIESYSVAVS